MLGPPPITPSSPSSRRLYTRFLNGQTTRRWRAVNVHNTAEKRRASMAAWRSQGSSPNTVMGVVRFHHGAWSVARKGMMQQQLRFLGFHHEPSLRNSHKWGKTSALWPGGWDNFYANKCTMLLDMAMVQNQIIQNCFRCRWAISYKEIHVPALHSTVVLLWHVCTLPTYIWQGMQGFYPYQCLYEHC